MKKIAISFFTITIFLGLISNEVFALEPEDIIFPPYDGPKTPVYVLPMGLSDREKERYPQLLKLNVGLGVHNIIKEALSDTAQFELVLDNPEIRKEIREIGNEDKAAKAKFAISFAKLLGATMAVYGEVYDYSEEITEETVLFSTKTQKTVYAGIQLHFINVETLKFLPVSGLGEGNRWATASQVAIRKAVLKYLNKLK